MSAAPTLIIDRYALFAPIASGGMATVHFGRLQGASGFARPVAIKRLHPQNATNPEFVAAFLDEARLAARVRHPNVVSVQDVVAVKDELLIVMDYVPGETLGRLAVTAVSRGDRVPPAIAVAILHDVLRGLEAAHDARNEDGELLNLVHRDISPQNILVGADGVSRIMDFGIAKALGRTQTTTDSGSIKGKAAYMAPEQIMAAADTRSDLWAASVVAWEILSSRRLFLEDSDVATLQTVLTREVPPLTTIAPDIPAALESVIEKGLQRSPLDRWSSAGEYADALAAALPPAPAAEVAKWVQSVAGEVLKERAAVVRAIERASGGTVDAVTPSAVVESRPAPPKRTRHRGAIAGAVGFAGVVLVTFYVAARSSPHVSNAPPVPSVTAEPTASVTAAPAAPSPSAPVAVPTPPPATSTATASATTAAPAHPPRPSSRKPRAGAGNAPSAPPSSSSKTSVCPYVDADGIVKFRPCS